MRTLDVVGNLYCSEKLIRGEANWAIYILVIYVLLGITAIVGNTLILIALHKNTSLHQPSKVLLRNLVASDLCVGFVQLAFTLLWGSSFCKDGGKFVAISLWSWV